MNDHYEVMKHRFIHGHSLLIRLLISIVVVVIMGSSVRLFSVVLSRHIRHCLQAQGRSFTLVIESTQLAIQKYQHQ